MQLLRKLKNLFCSFIIYKKSYLLEFDLIISKEAEALQLASFKVCSEKIWPH